jgi:hypothetical protein
MPDLGDVLDLSANMGQDQWMAEGGTDLLHAHRVKSLVQLAIVLVVLAGVGVGVFFFVTSSSSKDDHKMIAQPPADAAIRRPITEPMPDAPEISHDDIVALSHFGFFSITADSKTTIYVDGKLIGETPLTRLPLQPGPHTVKAVGPKGKKKEIKITIIGGRDDDEGTITWAP